MELFGRRCSDSVTVYFTGGATAVLQGWRRETLDTDIKVVQDSDAFMRLIPDVKQELNINIELACPADFIPELPDWKERSIFISKHGTVSFYHYDPYAQALAKIERGHTQDVQDVQNFFKSGLVDPGRLMELFSQVENRLYKYPALDPSSFRSAVEEAIRKLKEP